MNRRILILGLAAVAAVVAGFAFLGGRDARDVAPAPRAAALPVVTVYKSPTCGCCTKWMDHLKAAGFTVEAVDQADVSPVKAEHGVPRDLASCHTAIVDGYVVEGHVPADLIKKMLRERPALAGIAVPGMPIGSPGMEQGDRKDPYDVVAFYRNGERQVYARR